MNRKKILIFTPVAIGLIVILLAVAGAFGSGEAEPEAPVVEERAQPIRVVKPEVRTLPRLVTYSGSIEAWEQAYITAPSGARIEKIHVDEGDRVRRGQVLVNMESANLQQALVQLDVAKNDMERMRNLLEIGSVSKQRYAQAKAQYDHALSTVEMLQKNTELRSPIDGVVTAKNFVEGEMFMAGIQAPSLLTVMQTNPLKVVVNVSENYFPFVKQNMPAVIRLDMYPDRAFAGRVAKIHPTVDPGSRTFRVEVRVDNSEQLLSPGMFARVELNLGDVTGLFVPAATVLQSPGSTTYYVYVVEDGVARRRNVEVGDRFEDYRLIVDGLPEGALVISEGTGRLNDGSKVQIVE